jgi:hypothetical protein
LSDSDEAREDYSRKQNTPPVASFTSPEAGDLERMMRSGTLRNRPNLLECSSPIATFSPVQSAGQTSNTVTESSKVASSISSTMSTHSEVEKCKEVIYRALNLKKAVSDPLQS